MTIEERLADARRYLSAMSEGLCKRDPPEFLPHALREVARNLNTMADSAAKALESPAAP